MVIKKALVGVAALVASKHTISSALATSAAAAAVSPVVGMDPWTWVVGAVGAGVASVKLPETNKPQALANGVISVMLAGLGSEWAVKLITEQDFTAPNVYLIAFFLATCWPWLVSLAKKRIKKME